MRRIAVLVVVVILFRCYASDKFQEAIFWSIAWIFLLHCLISLKYAASDNFRWFNVPVHQYKLKMCLHFDQIRPWHRFLKHAFFGLYIHLKFLKTVFIAFDRKLISFFRFCLELRSFLSLFFFRFSIMCRRVFNKTIILLGLAGYEMIITNEARSAELVIYHFISSAPS